MEFVAGALRDPMAIGADPLGESVFPPPLTSWSPVSRPVGVGNATVTLHAPRPLPDAGVSATALLILGVGVTLLDRVGGQVAWTTAAALGGGAVLVDTFAAAAVLWFIYRLRRKVIVGVSPAGVSLSEQTLIAPAREVWPLDRVAAFRIDARGRRSDSILALSDGSTACLVRRGPTVHVADMHDVLVAALARPEPSPVARSAVEPSEPIVPLTPS